MTLIEVLSVIVLIGLVYSYIISDAQRLFRVSLSSSVERFASVVRFAYNDAILTGSIHRIVVDMGNPDEPIKKQKWFVQKGAPGALPIDKSKMGVISDGLREDDRVLSEPKFENTGERFIAELPKGIKILRVDSWRLGKDKDSYAESGEVAIYAYPNGFVDKASIYMMESRNSKEAQVFIVTINSLTGKIKLQTKLLPLTEDGRVQL